MFHQVFRADQGCVSTAVHGSLGVMGTPAVPHERRASGGFPAQGYQMVIPPQMTPSVQNSRPAEPTSSCPETAGPTKIELDQIAELIEEAAALPPDQLPQQASSPDK